MCDLYRSAVYDVCVGIRTGRHPSRANAAQTPVQTSQRTASTQSSFPTGSTVFKAWPKRARPAAREKRFYSFSLLD